MPNGSPTVSLTMNAIHSHPPPFAFQKQLSKRLLAALRTRPNTNVDITQLEQQFDFHWKSFLFQDPNLSTPFNLHEDPYFSGILHARIVESTDVFLSTLPFLLFSLPGLHPSQTPHLLHSQLSFMRTFISNKLAPVLTATQHPYYELLTLHTALEECAKQTSIQCIDSLKLLLRQQISALYSLREIQACVQTRRSFMHIIFQKGDELDCLATYPPRQLLEFFHSEEACFEELAEFFISGTRRGVSGAAGIEPSGSVKEAGIYYWMRRNRVIFESPRFLQLIASFEFCAALSPLDPSWHGIRVCGPCEVGSSSTDTDTDTAKADGGVKVPMPVLAHACGAEGLWIVSDVSQDTEVDCSLILPRVLHVLKSLVHRKVLQIQHVRCELLMASASRFRIRCKMQESVEAEHWADCEDAASQGQQADSSDYDELADDGPVCFRGGLREKGTVYDDGGGGGGATEDKEDKDEDKEEDKEEDEQDDDDKEDEEDDDEDKDEDDDEDDDDDDDDEPPQPSVTDIPKPKSVSPAHASGILMLKTIHVDIPLCLERDHAIMNHIKFFVDSELAVPLEALYGKFFIRLQAVAERVMTSSSYLKADSVSAASQWVSVVIGKLKAAIPDKLEVYKRTDKWLHSPLKKEVCACLIGRRGDLAEISKHILSILKRMQFERNFSDDWFCSRFAKNRSKKRRFEQKHGEAGSVSSVGLLSRM